MATEAITCPQCGAADPSPEDAYGVHVCTYCRTRYRLRGQVPVQLPDISDDGIPEDDQKPNAWIAGLALIGLGIAILGVVFVLDIVTDGAVTGSSPLNDFGVTTGAVDNERAPAPTASFEMHSEHRSSTGSRWVFGRVKNTSSTRIGRVKVHAILLDANGQEVGASQGFMEFDSLGPEETSPISILVNNAPEFASYRFEPDVNEASGWIKDATDLSLTALPHQAEGTRYRFAGSVKNESRRHATFVKVWVVGYDDDDQVVGFASTYAAGKEGIKPGESKRYNVTQSLWARPPTRFETHVKGRLD
jgi:hypothetical protein